jgi:hypothetical protein
MEAWPEAMAVASSLSMTRKFRRSRRNELAEPSWREMSPDPDSVPPWPSAPVARSIRIADSDKRERNTTFLSTSPVEASVKAPFSISASPSALGAAKVPPRVPRT